MFYKEPNFDKVLNEDDYNEYFYSISKYLPKNLVKYYNESYSGYPHNRFHDCVVKELKFKGNFNFFKNSGDEIILNLNLGGEIEYILDFQKIVSINISFDRQDTNYKDCFGEELYCKYSQNSSYEDCFGEILDCKLGLTQEKNYFIEFFTSTNFKLSLAFQKIKIKKLHLL